MERARGEISVRQNSLSAVAWHRRPRRPCGSRRQTAAPRFDTSAVEKGVDVTGEFGVMLKQEPVGRVGVDLQSSVAMRPASRYEKRGRIIGSLSPLAMNTGILIAPSLSKSAWFGVPHSHTASYCARRVCHVVGSSRFVCSGGNPFERLLAGGAAGCRPGIEDGEHTFWVGLVTSHRIDYLRRPAVHPCRALRRG